MSSGDSRRQNSSSNCEDGNRVRFHPNSPFLDLGLGKGAEMLDKSYEILFRMGSFCDAAQSCRSRRSHILTEYYFVFL